MDGDAQNNRLEERLSNLENRVEKLENTLKQKTESGDKPVEPAGQPVTTGGEEEYTVIEDRTLHEGKDSPDWQSVSVSAGESWLNRIGIGLLLIGVIFLFKYSIDQGWLIPPVRSLIGLLIGLGLFVTGNQMKSERTPFKQILLGGGIAVFYITGFATFQLYDFTSHSVVWLFMVVVTLLSLSLSLQQNEAVLSVVGIIGGLGTPFMLYTGQGSVVSLVVYTCLVLGGSGAIYLFKGWKSLLWTTVFGGWLVWGVALANQVITLSNPSTGDQWAIQAGVLFSLGVFWAVPVARELLSSKDPKRWPDPAFIEEDGSVDVNAVYISNPNVQVLSVIIPVGALFFSVSIWSLDLEISGAIALVSAMLVGYIYLPFRSRGLERLAMAHGFSAIILLTVSLFMLLKGEPLFVTLALEGLGLSIIAARTEDVNITITSHLIFGIIGLWLFNRFSFPPDTGPVLVNLDAVTQLFILVIAGLVTPAYLKDDTERFIYRLMAHIGILGWFFKELSTLDNGQAWVTTAWGIYAILIIVIGFWNNMNRVRLIGMGTVFLIVGKLFLVDLSQIQAILRILLFIGFGIVFLGLGYYLQVHMISDDDDKGEEKSPEDRSDQIDDRNLLQ